MDCLTAPAAMDINILDELLNGNLALDVDELLCAAEADDAFPCAEPVIGDNALDDFMSFIEEETRAKPKVEVVVPMTEVVEAPEAMEEEVVVEASAASLYSDDIWEKFSLPPDSCDLELDVDLAVDECSPLPLWSTASLEAAAAAMRDAKSHDCMWAGNCRSNEHKRSPRRQPRQQQPEPQPAPQPLVFPSTTDNSLLLASRSTTVPAAAGLKKRPTANNTRSLLARPAAAAATTANSRSLLRNGGPTRAVKVEAVERSPRPETPQSMVESEEDDAPVFRHTFDTIFSEGPFVETSTCEVVVGDEEDEDDDYEDEDVTEEDSDEEQQLVHASEVTGRRPPTDEEAASRTAVSSYYNDHSYTMSKGQMRTDNLGVQTPSDSEEEIDVVSVGDKPRGAAVSLPTNPSPHDRRQLQITVASAISSATARMAPVTPPTPTTSSAAAASQRAMPPTPPSSCDDADASPSTSTRKRQCHRGANKNAKRARHQQQQQQQQHRATHQRGRRGGGGGGGRFGGSDSEPDSCERRSLHNNMERQRRIDLRNLVENLRVLVPATEDKKRAAKVVILREAALYCAALRETGRHLVDVVSALRHQQESLRTRVSVLRRSLAAQR